MLARLAHIWMFRIWLPCHENRTHEANRPPPHPHLPSRATDLTRPFGRAPLLGRLLDELLSIFDGSSAGGGKEGVRQRHRRQHPAEFGSSAEWPALLSCEGARRGACEKAAAAAARLREAMIEAALNPLEPRRFGDEADRLWDSAIMAFEKAAGRWQGSPAYELKREALTRTLTAHLLALTRLQLRLVRDDAFATFKGERERTKPQTQGAVQGSRAEPVELSGGFGVQGTGYRVVPLGGSRPQCG